MKTWKNIYVMAAVLTIIGFGFITIGSAEEGKNLEQMITEAKTPADHEAIAACYDKEVQEAHQKQAEHKKLADSYDLTPKLKGGTMSKHCMDAAKKYEGIAKDYEAMAIAHRAMAKAAK